MIGNVQILDKCDIIYYTIYKIKLVLSLILSKKISLKLFMQLRYMNDVCCNLIVSYMSSNFYFMKNDTFGANLVVEE